MSTQPKNNTAKYANLNLNEALTSKPNRSGPGLAQANSTLTKGGLLLLSKKPRSASGVKLSVPKPVNLPSIKKEHAGNDPNTVLVPATGSGSSTWGSRPEDVATAPEAAPAIAPSSTWASAPKDTVVQPWHASAPPSAPPQRSNARLGLNEREFPTLADGAKADLVAVKHVKPEQVDNRAWADDERAMGRQDWRAELG